MVFFLNKLLYKADLNSIHGIDRSMTSAGLCAENLGSLFVCIAPPAGWTRYRKRHLKGPFLSSLLIRVFLVFIYLK